MSQLRAPLLFVLALLSGCGACSEQGVEVGGPHPYVRCAAVDEAEPREGSLGALRYKLEERTLTIEGAGDELSVLAFRAPGRASSDMAAALAPYKANPPELVLVLGGLTGSTESVEARLEALAALGVPTVVLAGGEDDAEALADALDDLPKGAEASVFDGRRLRSIVAGAHELVLVSGAPSGRYALDDGACGVSPEDLEELGESFDAPPAGHHRWLASWAAPAGGGPFSVARGFGDVDAGDPAIAALMKGIGAHGGIFAFPETRALLASSASGETLLTGPAPDARLVVAPVAGPPIERADGSLVAAGAALVTLSGEGLSYDGPRAAPRTAPSGAP